MLFIDFTYHFTRITYCQTIGRYVFGYNTSSPDDAAFANCYSRQNNNTTSNPASDLGHTEAFEYCKKLVDSLYPESMFYIGECYEQGKHVKQSLRKALKWYKEAALKGSQEAYQRCSELAEAGNRAARKVMKGL